MASGALDFESRLSQVEHDVATLKDEFSSIKDANVTTQQMVSEVNSQLADIRAFVTASNTIFGFAKKHWQKILSFGCGIMTAAGVGNPNVLHFIETFFGLGY